MNTKELRRSIIEKIPYAFESLDQWAAKKMKMSFSKYITRYMSTLNDFNNGKKLNRHQLNFLKKIEGLPFPSLSDEWTDRSYPDHPMDFCSLRVKGDTVKSLYLEHFIQYQDKAIVLN